MPFFVRSRLNEEFHLHLFEFARAKNEVSRRDFIAERFPDLTNSERRLLARRRHDVRKVHKDSLRGFGTQIVHPGFVVDGTEVRLQQSRELFGFGPLTASSTVTAGDFRKSTLGCSTLLFLKFFFEVVGAKSLVAGHALDEWVAEHIDVPRRFPHLTRQNDRRIEADNVGTTLHHRLPPLALDVLFQFNTEWAVIPRRTASPVDFSGLEDKSPSFRERNNGVKASVLGHGSP